MSNLGYGVRMAGRAVRLQFKAKASEGEGGKVGWKCTWATGLSDLSMIDHLVVFYKAS